MSSVRRMVAAAALGLTSVAIAPVVADASPQARVATPSPTMARTTW
ncbi:hypothetical protein OG809_33360 [Kribbella soli]